LPGHMEQTSVAFEKENNPFVQQFMQLRAQGKA